ncbi:hypothetical protein ACYZTX_00260 [Pseudomonas sp. MDT1-17]
MTNSLRPWLMLAAPLLAIVSVTLILPLTGELVASVAITAVAAFIITL